VPSISSGVAGSIALSRTSPERRSIDLPLNGAPIGFSVVCHVAPLASSTRRGAASE
jgi:hypothetical protein